MKVKRRCQRELAMCGCSSPVIGVLRLCGTSVSQGVQRVLRKKDEVVK